MVFVYIFYLVTHKLIKKPVVKGFSFFQEFYSSINNKSKGISLGNLINKGNLKRTFLLLEHSI